MVRYPSYGETFVTTLAIVIICLYTLEIKGLAKFSAYWNNTVANELGQIPS